MAKEAENSGPEDINSRILLMILDELRDIRKRLDAATGSGVNPTAPSPTQTPGLPEVKEDLWKAEIIETETPTEAEPDPSKSKNKARKTKPPEQAAEPKEAKPKAETPPAHAAATESQKSEEFGLQTPTSPQEEAELFSAQKQRVENMMAVAQFARAEKLAQALLAVMPDSGDAEAMLETVRRESTAFRSEQQTRLFAEFQRWTESRQWIKARTIGEQLIAKYPASEEGQTVAASMGTVRSNAHFEEARTLRDRIGDLIKRKRYSEAIDIAEDLMRRFPTTQVAKQLKSLLPDLKRRHAQFG